MAIKGVSDIRRLPRLGKIRLGEKTTNPNGKEYPKALDYFNCPPEVQKVYGEKPRALDIMLPVDDTSVFFPQWYKRYGKTTGLVCKGDGETATVIDTDTGEMEEIECVPDECEWYAKKHCRRLASLQFLLPKVPGLGVWQIDTTSFYSIINLNSALEMIRAVASRIHMLPLQLVLKPQEVTPDGRKKTVYVMDLMAPVTLSKLIAAGQTSPAKLLMPSLDENDRPDDLYPDGVLDREDPEPFNLGGAPAQTPGEQQQDPPPPEKPQPTQTKTRAPRGAKKEQIKTTNAGLEKMAAEDNAFWEQHAPPDNDGGQAQDPLDADLHKAWDILGTPQGKRQAQLAKPGLDKQALLNQLNGEIDRRVAENDGAGFPPEPPPRTPQNSPPPPPPPQAQGAPLQGSFF